MSRFFTFVYGCTAYLLFLATILYLIGFVADIPGLKTINTGVEGDARVAAVVDVLLLALFAAQHSIMARRGFKQWWTRFVPQPAERSTYVLAASLALALMIWQWRPISGVVWSVDDSAARYLLIALFGGGWAILFIASFMINHFELFGLQQSYGYWRGRRFEPLAFRTPALYRLVRHPIYLGIILGFWATPNMTVGHLLFSIVTTGYILLGIAFEERDLIAQFGNQYRRYKVEVGMLLPRLGTRKAGQADTTQRGSL